jgi:hypothetical protein
MPEHKKQHYVPRFYLRHWSEDGIGLYRYFLANETSERSNIENTCQSFYHHGKGEPGAELEKAISQLEAKQAPLLQEILDARNLAFIPVSPLTSPKDSQAFQRWALDVFILLTDRRTKKAKKEIEELANALLDILKPILAQSDEAKARGITPEALRRVRVRRDTANLEGIVSALINPSAISDLAVKLLINETKKPFITSDSPTVFYNTLKLGDMIMTGWQAPGLMIFLPLNKEIALWLFDPSIYKLEANTTNDGTAVLLRKPEDIDELNRLQILNADEFAIFPKPEYNEYVSSLHKPIKSLRGSELISRPEKIDEFDVGDERHEIHRVGKKETDYEADLSFFEVDKDCVEDRKKAYKAHVAKFGPVGRLFVRNEALFAFHVAKTMEILKKMRANKPKKSS